ncbi:hypothetical protein ACFPYI_02050 [Halomarina salina]|uniref:Uncharacterized protein n=1 Tax=Halomarina salina TaxID=1872699 RepID=A0ABD5RIB9_9EURY|nr:hypothetical protein [Halomarina salina]
MARDPLLSTETKITLVFMAVGLTAWYLAGEFGDSSELEFVALFGLGIVAPTFVNEARRHIGDGR